MNFKIMYNKLVSLIQCCLLSETTIEALNEYVWEIIDVFGSANAEDLPQPYENEREFWYALWQIQHLAGEEDDLIIRELREILKYLMKEISLPAQYEGRRPQNGCQRSRSFFKG